MRNTLLRRRKEDSGAAALEFALSLPLLLTVLFGVITYGYLMSFEQAIVQSTSEGARAAAITADTETTAVRTTKAKNAINNVMQSFGTQCDDNKLTCTVAIAACSNDTTRNCATITVSYNWDSYPKIPKFPLLPTPSTIVKKSIVEVS